MKLLLSKEVNLLSNQELSSLCEYLNAEYRKGNPLVSDHEFDFVYMKALSEIDPNHSLFTLPQETSAVTAKNRVKHPAPMLSTEKAYETAQLESFIVRCEKAAAQMGLNPSDLQFKVKAKLDGIAGRITANGEQLVTRGDGQFGTDITKLIHSGLRIIGSSSVAGVGEVVVPLDYFEQNLSAHFSHPRNFIAGLASSDNFNEHAEKALKDGAIHLVLYKDMPQITVNSAELLENLDALVQETKITSNYMLDGTIIEVANDELKLFMGSSSSNHFWQIALKSVGEVAQSSVKEIVWQVGKSGRLSPVINIEPVELSGAVISKVTAHHAGYIVEHGLGKGALMSLKRSGFVIPQHIRTEVKVNPDLPSECPCCATPVVWRKNAFGVDTHLFCESDNCSAQSVTKIIHFFQSVQADLFGMKSVEKLVASDYVCVEQILLMNEEAYMAVGFGAGQARNFVAEIQRLKSEPLRDNLLLASLGISKLGKGDSKKLLARYRINELGDIKPCQIEEIAGFGRIKANSIAKALVEQSETLTFLLNQNFNIQHTMDQVSAPAPAKGDEGLLNGINIVFTGTMSRPRAELIADATSKNACVQAKVNKKTNILCCGEKVGKTKTDAATKLGVEIITEQEYWDRY